MMHGPIRIRFYLYQFIVCYTFRLLQQAVTGQLKLHKNGKLYTAHYYNTLSDS